VDYETKAAPTDRQDSSQKSGFKGDHAFIEDSEEKDPAGGFEVVTKTPLGKCSINIER
jgi:hypothetical protein